MPKVERDQDDSRGRWWSCIVSIALFLSVVRYHTELVLQLARCDPKLEMASTTDPNKADDVDSLSEGCNLDSLEITDLDMGVPGIVAIIRRTLASKSGRVLCAFMCASLGAIRGFPLLLRQPPPANTATLQATLP